MSLLRGFLYVLFVLVAAPLDIVLTMVYGYTHNDHALEIKPLLDGALYVYAFVLACETWFRVFTNPQALKRSPHLKLTIGGSAIVILVFIIMYMGSVWPDIREGREHSSKVVIFVEYMCVALSLLSSYLSFHICENGGRKKPKERLM